MDRLIPSPLKEHSNDFLAFLYQQDTLTVKGKTNKVERRSPLLQLEAIDFRWWYSTIDRLGLRSLGAALDEQVGAEDFVSWYPRLSFELRRDLYLAHRRYMALMTARHAPAPVYLLSARFKVRRGTEIKFEEGRWYRIHDYQLPRSVVNRREQSEIQLFVSEIATVIANDPPTWSGENVRLQNVAPWVQTLLQALHFPQSMPTRESEEPAQTPNGVAETRPGGNSNFEVAAPASTIASTETEDSGHIAADHLVASNPMIFAERSYQPFVGVNWVGAGNNISLYGTNGAVSAHVDFGYPSGNNPGSYDDSNDPCLCDDAPIILSHWDYDHYAMVRKRPEALRRRWMAPQQAIGAVAARELYARLLNEMPYGADLKIWPASAKGGHIATNFGYIERATGKPSNDDCLAVFVRVKENMPPASSTVLMYMERSRPAKVKATDAGLIATGPIALQGKVEGVVLPTDLKNANRRRLIAVTECAHPNLDELNKARKKNKKRFKLTNGPAYWIEPKGIVRKGVDSENYVPAIATKPWMGGWAIQPKDFVDFGGVIRGSTPEPPKILSPQIQHSQERVQVDHVAAALKCVAPIQGR